MAVIRPFSGILYNKVKVGNLSKVVAPPYDVISPEDRSWYCDRHPNNIVRLILPEDDPSNSFPGGKYGLSAAYLQDWLREKILVQDVEPCVYACVQEYEIRGQLKRRLGLTCLVQLEDYENRKVLPHENIMTKPLDDRLNLMRTTRANFDSVFGLYANNLIEQILNPFLANKPYSYAVDRDGVKVSVWRITDAAIIADIAESLANESIVIADGHHRYAAALAYRNEMRVQGEAPDPSAPFEYVMMTLVSLEDKGLVVLPTHRLVRNVLTFRSDIFCSQLAELFDMMETPAERLLETVESMSSMHHVFGLYMRGGKSFVIKLKPTVQPERVIETPGSDSLKRLDVSVLHSLILEKLLGIGTQQLSIASNISFTRDVPGAIASIDRGENQILFLINSTRVDEVKAVAGAGDKMPQKSTFFYPKLLTGMVMRVMPQLAASR